MRKVKVVANYLLLAAGAAACRGVPEETPTATAVPVTLAVLTRDSLIEEIVVTGRLIPAFGHDAVLNAPAAGVIRRIAVPLGASVNAGQLILELAVPEFVAAARQQAAAAAQARREVERQRRLFEDGVTSRRQLEEAETAAHTADAAAIASEQLLAQTRVTSPIRGRVQQITVQAGSRVDAGTLLAEVIASDPLDLSAAVPGARLARIRLEQSVRVMSDGDTTEYLGRVATSTPAVDSLTGAGQVLVRIPNTKGLLRPGAGATACIVIGVRRNVLVAPDSAIVVAGDSLAVFVVGADSVAHQHTVTVGVRQGNRAELQSSLKPGDVVVTTGAAGLQDGMRVVPIHQPTALRPSTTRTARR